MSKIIEVSDRDYERMSNWPSMRGGLKVHASVPDAVTQNARSPEVMRDKAASLLAMAKAEEVAAAEKARAQKAAEQAASKAKAAKEATMQRIGYHQALGGATLLLLESIKESVLNGGPVVPEKLYVQFRKELSPLAKSYGFAIVVVGDRTAATLVKEN